MPPMQRPVQQAMPPAISQPPMMMNMGGMVDVFDPNFMNNLGSEIMDSNEDNIQKLKNFKGLEMVVLHQILT